MQKKIVQTYGRRNDVDGYFNDFNKLLSKCSSIDFNQGNLKN